MSGRSYLLETAINWLWNKQPLNAILYLVMLHIHKVNLALYYRGTKGKEKKKAHQNPASSLGIW